MMSKPCAASLQAIEQSHIQALTALIQAHDRVNPLDPSAEAWRHEAYKLSVQKKAIEDEAAHHIRRGTQKIELTKSAAVSAVQISLEREIGNYSHKISSALMRLELRLDRLQTRLEDRKYHDDRKSYLFKTENARLELENAKLKQEISDSEKLRNENFDLRKILADKLKDEKKFPITDEAEVRESNVLGKSEIGNLLAELKNLEAEARRLDFRSK